MSAFGRVRSRGDQEVEMDVHAVRGAVVALLREGAELRLRLIESAVEGSIGSAILTSHCT